MARFVRSNVFNPAALGLVVAYFAFGAELSWWGALPTLPVVAVLLVLGVGGFIAAATSFLVYLALGSVYDLPMGILVANARESWRRASRPAEPPRTAAAPVSR